MTSMGSHSTDSLQTETRIAQCRSGHRHYIPETLDEIFCRQTLVGDFRRFVTIHVQPELAASDAH